MNSMLLEQLQHSEKGHRKLNHAGSCNAPEEYPSTRYFQIHFQHLQEQIEILKEQIQEANRQIAAQNDLLQRSLENSKASHQTRIL